MQLLRPDEGRQAKFHLAKIRWIPFRDPRATLAGWYRIQLWHPLLDPGRWGHPL